MTATLMYVFNCSIFLQHKNCAVSSSHSQIKTISGFFIRNLLFFKLDCADSLLFYMACTIGPAIFPSGHETYQKFEFSSYIPWLAFIL